jgi:hypothetical protein
LRASREWIRYSELTDVISSVRLIAILARPVKRVPILWKWIILAAHSALQGAMVCDLSGSDETGALSVKSRAKMRKFLSEGAEGDVPNDWLAPFETLLEWIQDPRRRIDGVLWLPTEKERDGLSVLHHLRNDFSHFKPTAWSIEAKALPNVVETALVGTEHLMLDSSAVLRHITSAELRLLKQSLRKARRDIKQ